MSSNTVLWDKVCQTPPEVTKATTNGRFKFTTVDPAWQLHEATKLWGPRGQRWGTKDHKWTTITTDLGTTLQLDAVFFYPDPNVPLSLIEFEYSVDMKHKPGDDCCKKLLTSLRSKCLSELGFSNDIYRGMYDDVEYVKNMDIKYGDQAAFMQEALAKIKMAKSEKDLNVCTSRVKSLVAKDTISPDTGIELEDAIGKRLAQIFILS